MFLNILNILKICWTMFTINKFIFRELLKRKMILLKQIKHRIYKVLQDDIRFSTSLLNLMAPICLLFVRIRILSIHDSHIHYL